MNIRNVVIALIVVALAGLAVLNVYPGLSLGAKPTPTPAADQDEMDYLVTASGTLLPAQRANLSFKIPGQIQLLVRQGDVVRRGAVLARVDSAELEAAVKVAQAGLDQIKAGATKEEVASAQANLETAQAQLAKVRAGAAAEELAVALATLQRTQSSLNDAQSAYDKVKDEPAVGMFPQSQALHLATQEFRIAQARYNQVVRGATPEDIRIAETTVAAAQAALNRVRAPARPEELAAAQARIDQAKAALAGATLIAPFDGTVAAVSVREGEIVAAGVPCVTLGDLSQLRLETDDLSETSIARIRSGQPVNVTFEALAGKVFKGSVTTIAPIATAKQGGTNYTVIVELGNLDPVLRWGMTGHIEVNTR